MTARGIDLEVWERPRDDYDTGSPLGIIVPNAVRINGVDIATPSSVDEGIHLHPMTDHDAVKVTLTVFARSVHVAAGQPPEPDVDAYPIYRGVAADLGFHPILVSRTLAAACAGPLL